MPYILVMIFLTGTGGIQHVDSIRFDDAVACESTKKLISAQELRENSRQILLCVPASNHAK